MRQILGADIDGAGAVGEMLRSVLLFLPKALAFIAILLVGWLIAKAVRKLVNKVLERVGFDRLVERGGVKSALQRSSYDASDIVAKLAYYGLLLFTLQLAFGIWGPNPISALITAVVAWLPRAFVAIVIVVVAAAIATAVKDLITGALGGLSYGRLLANIASVFILGLGIIAALNQIGVATTVTTPLLIAALATVAGILIVGVGGGLVRPMQQRWEGWLNRAERESQVIAERSRAYSADRAHRDADLTQPVAYPDPAGTTVPVNSTGTPDATVPVTGTADPTVPVSRTADPTVPVSRTAGQTVPVASAGAGDPTVPVGHIGIGSDPTVVLPANRPGGPDR